MKKILTSLALSLAFALPVLSYADALREYRKIHAKPSTFQKIKTSLANFYSKSMGTRNVSKKTETLVREVQKELDMLSWNIPVKQKDDFIWSDELIYADAGNRLFINERPFYALSEEEKKYIIAFKLRGIQQHDFKRTFILDMLLPAFAWYKAFKFYRQGNKSLACLAGLSAFMFHWLHQYLNRHMIKNFDEMISYQFNNSLGGFKILQRAKHQPRSENTFDQFCDWLESFGKIPLEERIAYFQKVVNKQYEQDADISSPNP